VTHDGLINDVYQYTNMLRLLQLFLGFQMTNSGLHFDSPIMFSLSLLSRFKNLTAELLCLHPETVHEKGNKLLDPNRSEALANVSDARTKDVMMDFIINHYHQTHI